MSDPEQIKKDDVLEQQIEEGVISTEDYEHALEVLNSSKNSRVKKIQKEKEDKKKKAKEAKKKEMQIDPSQKLTFIEKCAKDPVIPVCILLAILAVIGACIYFILPMVLDKSLGITYDDFRKKYETNEIYTNLLADYDLSIPAADYSLVTTTDELNDMGSNKNLDYFRSSINSVTNIAIVGSTRKFDHQLVNLRVLVQYDEERVTSQFIIFYFASYIQTVMNTTSSEALNMSTEMFSMYDNSGSFIRRGDIAYRLILGSEQGISYVGLDIIPAENIA